MIKGGYFMDKIEFIKKEEEKINKYEVSFDGEKLNEIKEKIFNETSIKQHRSFNTEGPISERWINSPNYKVTLLWYVEKDNYDAFELVPLFHIEYDEVIYQSPLVDIINKLLNNNIEGLKNIRIYEESVDNVIRNNDLGIDDNYNAIASLAKIKKFEELKKIFDNLSMIISENKKFKREKEYILEINNLFTITKVDSIDEETYSRVLTFKKMTNLE